MGWIFIDLNWQCKTTNEPLLFPLYHTHLTLYISLDGLSGTYFVLWVLLHVIGVRDGCTVSRLGKMYWVLSYCEVWGGFLVWSNLMTLVYDMTCLLCCFGSVCLGWWYDPTQMMIYHDGEDLLTMMMMITLSFHDSWGRSPILMMIWTIIEDIGLSWWPCTPRRGHDTPMMALYPLTRRRTFSWWWWAWWW